MGSVLVYKGFSAFGVTDLEGELVGVLFLLGSCDLVTFPRVEGFWLIPSSLWYPDLYLFSSSLF